MLCPSCQNEADVLLIDTFLALGSRERETVRYCASCRPEALHPLAGHSPRVLHSMGLSADVLRAALEGRRYVKDLRGSYPLKERLRDLGLKDGRQ